LGRLGREVLEREGRVAGPLGFRQHLADMHLGELLLAVAGDWRG
jgi:hypothetical protein